MCGIWGSIGFHKRKFNYSAFCTLGIHNDSRGGDSCGVFIDGNVEYGVQDKKMFEDFMESSVLLQRTEECYVAIGHDRKASVGAINESTAQPVVIRNDKSEIEFVVVNNGTIYNYEELAKKYIPEIDIKGMTDSQVMTHIFYHKGYDVLSEYNGGAVFVIVDYRGEKPKFLLWKGCSKLYSTSASPQEERPLYFCIKDGELNFSSIGTFLPVFFRNAEIFTLNDQNYLCEFTDEGKLVIVKQYPRTDKVQSKIYVTTNSYNAYWDRYHNSSSYSHVTSNTVDGSTKDGRCYFAGKPIHGSKIVSEYGVVKTEIGKDAYEMWFWDGILLYNRECFIWLEAFCKDFGSTPHELFNYYPEMILYLSPYHFYRTSAGLVELVTGCISAEPYTGEFCFPFTSKVYEIKNGELESERSQSYAVSLNPYINNKDKKISFEEMDLLK